MHFIKAEHITIAKDRQRQLIDQDKLLDLANSMADVGLINPVVVRFDDVRDEIILVAGERRLRAAETLWGMGQSFTHAGINVPEGQMPCTYFKDLDPIVAFEIELEENIRRQDITWQEQATATSELYELKRLKAVKAGLEPPDPPEAAAAIYPGLDPGTAVNKVRTELILARAMKDPDVAKAASAPEALKVIKRKEEAARQVALGVSVGKTFGAHSHQLWQGSCLDLLPNLAAETFDVILTDPPYGIDAQDFNDSGGKASATGHTYDDSYTNWLSLSRVLASQSYRLAKPQAHCYIFCDVDRFVELRTIAAAAGWKPFRTPFVWHNPSSQRAPWPHTGPHRRYQLCLYAVKGDRPVLKLAPDLVTYASDTNLGWAAQKPVALYADFLSRSCRAGDSVLDPFCGSGTIFPAAHGLRVKATGMEIDPVAYGIAVKRIGELR